jgi:hypothetical protein
MRCCAIAAGFYCTHGIHVPVVNCFSVHIHRSTSPRVSGRATRRSWRASQTRPPPAICTPRPATSCTAAARCWSTPRATGRCASWRSPTSPSTYPFLPYTQQYRVIILTIVSPLKQRAVQPARRRRPGHGAACQHPRGHGRLHQHRA